MIRSPALLLAALAAAVYAPTLTAPVLGDDRVFVHAAAWHALAPLKAVRELFSSDYFAMTGEGSWQPLVSLLHYLAGPRVALYRLLGVLLHFGNACLLRAAARRFGLDGRAALAAAALFLLHPVHPDALIVSSFKGHLLVLGFGLGALLFWEKGRLGPALACLAGALLSKETGVAAAAFPAAYSLCVRRTGKERDGLAAALALLLAYLILRLSVFGSAPGGARAPLEVWGWALKTLVWPLPLCREYLRPSALWWVPALHLAALWAARKRPAALAGLLLLGAGVLPFAGLVPFYAESPVALRYLYLACAGFALAAAAVVPPKALPPLLIACSAVSFGRNLLHRDQRALYEQTAACAPAHHRAWGVLAGYYLQEKEYAPARAAAEKALALAPDYGGARAVLTASCHALEDRKCLDGLR